MCTVEKSKLIGVEIMKKVDASENPGLSKLPTEVRNKMGYMKKGGMAKKKMNMGGSLILLPQKTINLKKFWRKLLPKKLKSFLMRKNF